MSKLSPELRQAIIDARGKKSATVVASELGVPKGTVAGTWQRAVVKGEPTIKTHDHDRINKVGGPFREHPIMKIINYTAAEDMMLRDLVFSGEPWTTIVNAFPARSPYGVKRHAVEIGIVTSTNGRWPQIAEDDDTPLSKGSEMLLAALREHHETGTGELSLQSGRARRLPFPLDRSLIPSFAGMVAEGGEV